MANLYRLIYLVLVCLLFCVPSLARADYQAVKHYSITVGAYTTPEPLTDYTQVCQDFVTWLSDYHTTSDDVYVSSTETGCYARNSKKTFDDLYTTIWKKDCSDGLGFRGWDSTPGGTNGNCPGDPPPEPEACEDGRELDRGHYQGPGPLIACIEGCRALRVSDGAPVLNCSFSGGSGLGGVGTCAYQYPAHFIDIGVSCDPSNTPPKEPPPISDCPQCRCAESGGAWGSVGGVSSCLPQGTPGSSPVTKPSAPPTVTTTTPAPTPENPNPEPVVTETPAPVITVTPPPAGSPVGTPPTVTETTTDPETGGTVTTEKDKKSYCQENPTAQICRDDDKSMFSGSCGSWRCEGDAVQCAIAREQHQRNCEFFKEDAVKESAFNQLVSESGSLNMVSDQIEKITVDVPSSLEKESVLTRACPVDVEFTVFGQLVTMPISEWCPYLAAIGYLFLAISYIAAARIMGGSL